MSTTNDKILLAITNTNKRLVAICNRHFPYEVTTGALTKNGDSEQDNWDLVAPGFVFTGASCLCSIIALAYSGLPRGGTQDAFVLVRRLYEYAVTFAWIAVDPPVHVKAWLASDYENRLKVNKELRELGDNGLEAKTERKYRQYVTSRPRVMGDVKSRAIEADRYWATRVELHGRKEPMPSPRLSFETLYTLIYRGASADAHATAGGLTPWIHGLGNGAFMIGTPAPNDDDREPFALAAMAFASWMFIAEKILGWPAEADIIETFASWDRKAHSA